MFVLSFSDITENISIEIINNSKTANCNSKIFDKTKYK